VVAHGIENTNELTSECSCSPLSWVKPMWISAPASIGKRMGNLKGGKRASESLCRCLPDGNTCQSQNMLTRARHSGHPLFLLIPQKGAAGGFILRDVVGSISTVRVLYDSNSEILPRRSQGPVAVGNKILNPLPRIVALEACFATHPGDVEGRKRRCQLAGGPCLRFPSRRGAR
jgi:hypothetical protein